MHRTTPAFSSTKQHWLQFFALVVGIFCLMAAGMIRSATPAHADGIPGGNVSDPVIRAVDIAQPAVVRILTTLNGRLTVHFSSTQNITFPQNSSGYPLTLSGTGAFISAHGDILTADHVVNPPHDSQLDQYLDDTAAKDVASYYNQNIDPAHPATSDEVAQALKSGQLPSNTQYDSPGSEVFLSTGYTGPLTAPNLNSVPSTIHATVDKIEQQSTFNEKDVAIVHVSNMDDMASIQLGDSSSVSVQDQLRIIGFPGNGDVNDTPTNLLTSSVNEILVSSIKTAPSGAPVIQVGGNVEQGDSGGPALDTQGNVVGIVSFGVSDSPGSTSFLQASNSARDLVQAQRLDTTPGNFQKIWSQAFMDYAATTPGHWHKAQREFEQLEKSYPLFKAITPYLTYASTQAKNEHVPQQQPGPAPQTNSRSLISWVIIGVGAIILLLVLIFATILVRRRSKKAAKASRTAQPSQIPSSAVPPQPLQSSPAPPQPMYGSQQSTGMAAFGAPSTVPGPVQNSPQSMPGAPLSRPGSGRPLPPTNPSVPAGASGTLIPWPCGHMNRPNARYCSICGEPAPASPVIRRYEQ